MKNKDFKNRTTLNIEGTDYDRWSDGGGAVSAPIKKIVDNNKFPETIIINRMYAGGYLESNIGHEIINTYQTDCGENYIYVNPYGTISKEKSNVKYIFLVRAITKHCFEVIAVAGDLSLLLSNKALNAKKQADIGVIDYEKQLALIEMCKINYGGKPVNTLFSEQSNTVYFTFKSDNYMSANKNNKFYIYDDETLISNKNDVYIPGITFSSQSLKMYISNDGKTSSAYKVLLDLAIKIENDHYQNETNPVNLDKAIDDTFSIVDILGQENDELSYSNWLYFYLNNDKELLSKFFDKVLEISLSASELKLQREYHNVDLWIENDDQIVVIENKIKSGINGVDQNRHNIKHENVQSQLSKYVDFAEREAAKDGANKNTSYYIFLPDYSYKDEDLKNYLCSDKYKIVRYSSLLKFFLSNSRDLPYYDDFIKAIKKHSAPYRKDLFEIIDDRLIHRIKSLENS